MLRILVIEDAAGIKEYILAILKKEGFEAIGASNGRVGLQVAQEFLPDLILCDINIPELDGYEVLKHLRQNPKLEAIPFIFLTSLADMTSLRKGMILGADDYLTKPININELLEAIATQLQKEAISKKHYIQLNQTAKNTLAENKSIQTQEIKAQEVREKLLLSPRQHKIIQLVTQGKNTREIADELEISIDAAELLENIAMRLNKRLHRTDNSDPAVPKVDYDQIQETRLTPRQLQILKFVSEGMTTKEIADELFISVKTVETHRGQIMERLNIHDLAGLIRHAIRMGLTSLD